MHSAGKQFQVRSLEPPANRDKATAQGIDIS
jgi:hypothetical protein